MMRWIGIGEPVAFEWIEPERIGRDLDMLADHARELLADPLLQEAFETIRSRYRKIYEESQIGERDKRELAYLSMTALRDIEVALRTHLHNERLAIERGDKNSRRRASNEKA